jgi:hypothetical protein
VVVTILVDVSITETEPKVAEEFVTYTRLPSGVMATPTGWNIEIVAITALVAVAITETELEPAFAT